MRPDIEHVLATFGNKKMRPSKKEIKMVEEVLWPDETALYISATNIEIVATNAKKKESSHGVCVLTDKRFWYKGGNFGGDTTESIMLDKIDSVNSETSILFNHLCFHALTKSYKFLCGDKKEMQKLQKTFEDAIRNYSPIPANSSSNPNPLDQIKQLAELRDGGAISNEEYESKKSELLSRL